MQIFAAIAEFFRFTADRQKHRNTKEQLRRVQANLRRDRIDEAARVVGEMDMDELRRLLAE